MYKLDYWNAFRYQKPTLYHSTLRSRDFDENFKVSKY